MRILLVSSSSGSRGGGELYLLYLGEALAARGHEVILWTSSHPRMDELCAMFAPIGKVARSKYTNTYDYRLRSVSTYVNVGVADRVAREWEKLAPDVIHLNKQNLEDGLDLLRATELAKRPHLTSIHLTQTARYLRAQFAGLRDYVAKRALRRDRGLLVCVLDERCQDLARFIGDSSRIRTVPNGVRLYDLRERPAIREAQRRMLEIEPDQLMLVAVGRMMPQKRPFVFLDLAERIHAKLPATKFVWVGDGKLAKHWDGVVHDRKLTGIVQRIGWQSDVRDFLFAADAFVHTAAFEGLPLAILEALSAGLPCAITPNLIAEMPFLNDSNSITIGDDEKWVSVLSDPARMRELGENARKLAEAEFSYDLMAARYEDLYREATAAHGSAG